MIDISDGLVQDLGHLCAASAVGARLRVDWVPCSPQVRRAGVSLALIGGEDYELLCAVPARHHRRAEVLAARLGCPFTYIGECVARREGVEVVDAEGRVVRLTTRGHDHFAPRRRPP
jgi:thiamine-monophosphate kinase